MMMIGQNHHLSAFAAGCAVATSSAAIIAQQQQQKLPKARYGAFFSGMMPDMDREAEEEEYFARRYAAATANRKRAKSPRPCGMGGGDPERKGFSRRLLGKLVKLITVKEFTFLPSGKTFPSRDAKKAAAAAKSAMAKRRPHNSSQSSTLSGSFEPMPTIEEETESELMQQLMAEAEAILEMGQQMHSIMSASSSSQQTFAAQETVPSAAAVQAAA